MDQELKRYLDEKFAGIGERFTGMASETTDAIDGMEERILARLDRFEAALLAAFRGAPRPAGLDERRILAEQRISELERKRAS
jgi:hypothetical protein